MLYSVILAINDHIMCVCVVCVLSSDCCLLIVYKSLMSDSEASGSKLMVSSTRARVLTSTISSLLLLFYILYNTCKIKSLGLIFIFILWLLIAASTAHRCQTIDFFSITEANQFNCCLCSSSNQNIYSRNIYLNNLKWIEKNQIWNSAKYFSRSSVERVERCEKNCKNVGWIVNIWVTTKNT